MILCCGEALVDFIPVEAAGFDAYRPAPGGSPYNVALALGRLGARVGFMGGLSTDLFGTLLSGTLAESGVDLAHTVLSDRPTVLAFVSLRADEPQYAFYDQGSASRLFDPADARPPGEDVACLHCGSISLIGEPAASQIERFCLREARRRVISIDPNVRPSLVRDEPAYRARLARLIAAADIVKISRADLAWLAPDAAPEDWARERVEEGAALVVLTAGAQGAVAFTGRGRLRRPAFPVEVADTVGAGDAFTAGLLASLQGRGLLTREALAGLAETDLAEALTLAARVAAFTCGRPGADPPRLAEIGGEAS